MWYSASLLFRGVHNEHETESDIWEESIVIVQAETELLARRLFIQYATEQCTSYETTTGDNLQWKFDSIERILDFEFMEDKPCEVFSRFLRNQEVESLKTPFED